MWFRLRIKFIASAGLPLILAGSAAAQCAMCKATLAGDPHAAAASRQMNLAVLLLLIPAVVIFSGFFVLMYRYRNYFRRHPTRPGVGRAGDPDGTQAGPPPAFPRPQWLL